MRYCFLRFPGGKLKAVTLSYDDGVKADARLAEILGRYGMKATFNINAGYMGGNEKKLSAEEIKTHLIDAGHEVAVHGDRHIAPGVADPVIVINDVLTCRKTLEATFGGIIRGMAYPDSGIRRLHNGNRYEEIRRYLADLGIVYARTLGGDNDDFGLPEDLYAWMPTAHHNNKQLSEYVEKFLAIKEEGLRSAGKYPRLFYLWGHSYEFDNNDNWQVIEDFCAAISGKEDIWYATNIEICEYMLAFRSIVTSADGSRLYNPTLKTLFMDIDGKPYRLAPGEMLEIL